MSSPRVRCTVNSCAHNMKNQCMAANISIFNDEATGVSNSSMETQCQAFQSKASVGDMMNALGNTNYSGTISSMFVDGTQMTPNVRCFANNCRFWKNGNLCTSSEINVAGASAVKHADTDCETFVPK